MMGEGLPPLGRITADPPGLLVGQHGRPSFSKAWPNIGEESNCNFQDFLRHSGKFNCDWWKVLCEEIAPVFADVRMCICEKREALLKESLTESISWFEGNAEVSFSNFR